MDYPFYVGGSGQDYPDQIGDILVRFERRTIRFERVKTSKNSRCVGLLRKGAIGATNTGQGFLEAI